MSRISPIIILLLSIVTCEVWAQGTNIQFGQNRVQYKDFEWNYFESENFKVYGYTGGRELSQFVARVAEADLKDIQKKLDYIFKNQIDILVYNDISDLNQSNIGMDDQEYNTGGRTQIIDNKVFVYFNGDHRDLKIQIRRGLATIMVKNMVFGGNVQEILQNAVMLNLPEWYVHGLIAYVGENWNTELDDKLRHGILNGDFKKFNHLTGPDAELVGQAMWHYVAERYGQQAVPNLIYLTRINRSVDNGFLYVVGSTVKQTIDEWYEYQLNDYLQETKNKDSITGEMVTPKLKGNNVVTEVKISENGRYIAYVTHYLASFKVMLYDREKNSTRTVFKGGYKTNTLVTDYSYPLLAFTKNSRNLGIIYEKKDIVRFMDYEIDGGKKEKSDLLRFQKVLSFNYMDAPRQIVLSATVRGQSDIYTYKMSTGRTEQLTNDFYDDLYPDFVSVEGGRGIVFSSNRFSDTLAKAKFDEIMPLGQLDIFYYEYGKKKPKNLIRITNTINVEETWPGSYDDRHISYLSNQNGFHNRFAAYLDSSFYGYDFKVFFKDSISWNPPELDSLIESNSPLIDSVVTVPYFKKFGVGFPVTDLGANIIRHDLASKKLETLDVMRHNGQTVFYIRPIKSGLNKFNAPVLENTSYRNLIIGEYDIAPEMKKEKKKPKPEKEEPHFFQSEFDFKPTVKKVEKEIKKEEDPFKISKLRQYNTRYTIQQVTTQLDNSLFIDKYQNFNSTGGVFISPELSGLFTFRAKDVFEDYIFEGGFRVPTTFSGTEFFLTAKDRRKRLDKELLFYSKSSKQPYNFQPLWFSEVDGRLKTNYTQLALKYPIDVVKSVRTYFGYRDDKVYFKSNDTFSLHQDNLHENWLNFQIEFVHDNAIQIQRNIPLGSKLKVFYEFHKKFIFDLQNGTEVSFDEGSLSVLGLDARHYTRVHRNIIWANRFSAGTSFGDLKLIYYLGGVDGWLLSEFTDEITIDQNAGYAFQTLATNMRGFPQNIRNGNNYAVYNTEIRVPIFSYLFNKPIRSDLLRTMQVVAFTDIGTAWQGKSPFSQDNPFNVRNIVVDPLNITVRYFRNPVVMGYGFGFRTMLLGYFARLDFAWGLDTGEVRDRMVMFSLGLDF